MSELVCYNCGARNSDPGGVPLDTYECGQCGQRTLIRPKPTAVDKVSQALAGGLIGCTIGACLIGFPGMFIGALIGAMLGGMYKS
jgi:DNA-directed RNA polymerase subunit RPC12/RpoP